MNTEFLEEVDTAVIPYILRRMVKENKRYKRTRPFHSLRSCEGDCIVHERTKR